MSSASEELEMNEVKILNLPLLPAFEDLANPLREKHGIALADRNEPKRARHGRGLDNDF